MWRCAPPTAFLSFLGDFFPYFLLFFLDFLAIFLCFFINFLGLFFSNFFRIIKRFQFLASFFAQFFSSFFFKYFLRFLLIFWCFFSPKSSRRCAPSEMHHAHREVHVLLVIECRTVLRQPIYEQQAAPNFHNHWHKWHRENHLFFWGYLLLCEGVQVLLFFGKKKRPKNEPKSQKILEKKFGKKMAKNPISIGILKEFGKNHDPRKADKSTQKSGQKVPKNTEKNHLKNSIGPANLHLCDVMMGLRFYFIFFFNEGILRRNSCRGFGGVQLRSLSWVFSAIFFGVCRHYFWNFRPFFCQFSGVMIFSEFL